MTGAAGERAGAVLFGREIQNMKRNARRVIGILGAILVCLAASAEQRGRAGSLLRICRPPA
jgi:hypothetical protein